MVRDVVPKGLKGQGEPASSWDLNGPIEGARGAMYKHSWALGILTYNVTVDMPPRPKSQKAT